MKVTSNKLYLFQAKGYDTSQHALACFGGAGGQHACAIARSLGMSTVFIHKYAGILSAYGMALADVVEEAQEPSADAYSQGKKTTDISEFVQHGFFFFSEFFKRVDERFDVLENKVIQKLKKQGFTDDKIKTEYFLHLRYEGTDCSLMCTTDSTSKSKNSPKHGDFEAPFLERCS